VGLALLRQHPDYLRGYMSVVTLLCLTGRRDEAAMTVEHLRTFGAEPAILAEAEHVLAQSASVESSSASRPRTGAIGDAAA
jgi:hypothetical protein